MQVFVIVSSVVLMDGYYLNRYQQKKTGVETPVVFNPYPMKTELKICFVYETAKKSMIDICHLQV